MQFTLNCEILWNFRKIRNSSDFSEIRSFQGNHPSKPSIFLREYWCVLRFAHFREILDFCEKWKSVKKSISVWFRWFYWGIHCFAEISFFHPGPPKINRIYLVFKGLAHPGREGAKTKKLWKVAKYFLLFRWKLIFGAKSWKSYKFPQCRPSQTIGNPCKKTMVWAWKAKFRYFYQPLAPEVAILLGKCVSGAQKCTF